MIEKAEDEQTHRETWGTRLSHGTIGHYTGTSYLDMAGDTPTLTRFHDLLNSVAHELYDPNDPLTDDLELRKIRALGIIVDRATGAATQAPRLAGRPSSTSTSTAQPLPTPPSESAKPSASDRSPPS